MRTHRELVVTVNCAAPRGACSGRRSETPRVTGQQVSRRIALSVPRVPLVATEYRAERAQTRSSERFVLFPGGYCGASLAAEVPVRGHEKAARVALIGSEMLKARQSRAAEREVTARTVAFLRLCVAPTRPESARRTRHCRGPHCLADGATECGRGCHASNPYAPAGPPLTFWLTSS